MDTAAVDDYEFRECTTLYVDETVLTSIFFSILEESRKLTFRTSVIPMTQSPLDTLFTSQPHSTARPTKLRPGMYPNPSFLEARSSTSNTSRASRPTAHTCTRTWVEWTLLGGEVCAEKLKGVERAASRREGVLAVWGRRAMAIVDMVVCARPLRVISTELETRPGCFDGAYTARGSVSPVYPLLETDPDETGSGVGRDTVRVVDMVEERERMLVGRGRFELVDIVRARIGVFLGEDWSVCVSSRSSSSSQRALMRSGRVFWRLLVRGLGLGQTGSYSTSTRSRPCMREERDEAEWSGGTSQRTSFDQSGGRERDLDLRRIVGWTERLVADVVAD